MEKEYIDDVSTERNKYIGGSDIPVILGISPFKTRFQLIQEKAKSTYGENVSNQYTEYGHYIEPLIREHINKKYGTDFEPTRDIIEDKYRLHTDGVYADIVLEIKSTSRIKESLNDYKEYLAQLLFYMKKLDKTMGLLAVYERPSDFNEEFNSERLTIYEVEIQDYVDFINQIEYEVERFERDVELYKENPLMTEEDFLPSNVSMISRQLATKINQLKSMEEEIKKFKENLLQLMEESDIKKIKLDNGTNIIRVLATEDKTITNEEFDLETFKQENEEIYEKYVKKVPKTIKGKSAYLQIK